MALGLLLGSSHRASLLLPAGPHHKRATPALSTINCPHSCSQNYRSYFSLPQNGHAPQRSYEWPCFSRSCAHNRLRSQLMDTAPSAHQSWPPYLCCSPFSWTRLLFPIDGYGHAQLYGFLDSGATPSHFYMMHASNRPKTVAWTRT